MTLRIPVDLLGPLLEGSKRQHRIPIRKKPPNVGRRVRVRGVHPRTEGEPRRRLSRTVCDAIVVGCWAQALEDMTEDDARAEGFRTLAAFLDHWQAEHGEPPARTAEMCWVLRLQVVPSEDVPRLLTPSGMPAHSELGYTQSPSKAMRDEPEAVDEATQTRFSADAESMSRILRAERQLEERARTLGRRLREQTLHKGRSGVNVSPELDEIEAALKRLEDKEAA